MKVSVDPDLCAAHGACMVTSPAVFRIGDDGWAEVLVDEVPPELEEQVERAVLQCPAHAISISGDPAARTD